MKNNMHKLALSITATILAACGAQAYEVPLTSISTNLPPLDFHGFVSQGLLASSQYNYLADNTKNGSLEFFEAGANVSMNPFPHTHVTAQGFMFDVGNVGQYDPTLDYGLIDYNFNDAIGVRVGRILRPEGIYNSIQSIDLARTSVLLPQGMYDARFRDFDGSVDGGSIYGDLGLSKAGDLSYEIYGGMVNLSQNGGISRELQDAYNHPPYVYFKQANGFPEVGAQLWWNTPVNGLRAGLAGYQAFGMNYNYYMAPFIPGGFGNSTTYINATQVHPSLEYLWKSWTFQAEYRYAYDDIHTDAGGKTVSRSYQASDTWYAGAAYRFNKWFETGAYYTEAYNNVQQRDNSLGYQKDLALSFRFDPKPWWVFKVEGHYIRGTGLLNDNANNPVQNSDGWFMLAVKTTFSF